MTPPATLGKAALASTRSMKRSTPRYHAEGREDHEDADEDPGRKIDFNKATSKELMKCPKVGKILAQRILASRKVEKFTSWAEVRRLPQIGPTITASLHKMFYMPGGQDD